MICIIAAVSKNGVIGKDGHMPWRIPGELKRFRELTTGHTVIMGRKTYESIGKPLPDRRNIILSRTHLYTGENVYTARTLREAVEMFDDERICITGGEKVFEEGLVFADVLYLTEIDAAFEGDTFFPAFDQSLYEKSIDEVHEGEIPYTYVTYTRK